MNHNIKRCTKCVLPATFPFIEFDKNGVCNYCNNHRHIQVKSSFDDLIKLVEPYRKNNGNVDCIVPFSGGRDSTLALHIIKKELKLNPVAFTYDWGMATDLAYKNAERVCKKLGVKNVIVKANIPRKRDNIRKNVTAWLKRPELGMIPLFMAGDKWFFYYCNQLKKELNVKLNIWGVNRLENTEFKTGFAGLRPDFDKKTIYSLNVQNQLKLFVYVAKNILGSPGYINGSMIDSLGSFASRYLSPKRDYFHLFDYYKWDEQEVNNLIINEYDYELAADSPSTWRIGDGTAAFYNYIYHTVAGFSEYDTFRSNQIREGMISREEAIEILEKENQPRFDSIKWYLDIINLDYDNVLNVINNIPKLY